MSGISGVVFDFDGLLMDTESCMLGSWQQEWRHHGLELDPDSFWFDHGGDVTKERYEHLAKAVGPSYDQTTSHARRIGHRDLLHAELHLRSGISAWLDEAEASGLRLAVASSSPNAWVHGLLAGVTRVDWFAIFAGGDEVPAPKPDPSVYRLALQRLNLPPDQVIAVEDAPHGIAAAQAAGLRCVAVPNPHMDPNRLAAAELVLTSATEMTLAQVLHTVRSRIPS
ncbi:MAG: HAD family hydrolase [Nocardioidaceae bacterium]